MYLTDIYPIRFEQRPNH